MNFIFAPQLDLQLDRGMVLRTGNLGGVVGCVAGWVDTEGSSGSDRRKLSSSQRSQRREFLSPEEQAQELAQDAARLAADQESLRRSLETEQQAFSKGAETLDLVKKRFAADLIVINELLITATERTATLAKSLEL